MNTGRLISPLNKGQICPKAPIGPRPVYCPIANSMNNIGIPHTINIKKYGIKKAPKKKQFQNSLKIKLIRDANISL